MTNRYQEIPREIKETRECWEIVRNEYEPGLNNYFGKKADYDFMFDKKSTERRLKHKGK